MLIDQTTDYKLVVGTFPGIESVSGRRVYGIINKAYNVVEAVGPGLPAALTTLYGLQSDLDGAREGIALAKRGEHPDTFSFDEFDPSGGGYTQ